MPYTSRLAFRVRRYRSKEKKKDYDPCPEATQRSEFVPFEALMLQRQNDTDSQDLGRTAYFMLVCSKRLGRGRQNICMMIPYRDRLQNLPWTIVSRLRQYDKKDQLCT
jgi:hypothetical protein